MIDMNEHEDTYRLYGLTAYNLSPIQQGIQFGHALQELNNKVIDIRTHGEVDGYSDDEQTFLSDFYQWSRHDKTFIILNGGTSITMEQHVKTLEQNGIITGVFREPDLNNMLSGIVFVVPEQVYKREEFPDFDDRLLTHPSGQLTDEEYTEFRRQGWIESMGGEKNVFLREFVSQFKLA